MPAVSGSVSAVAKIPTIYARRAPRKARASAPSDLRAVTFPDAPKSVNDKLKDSAFKNAIDKGMTKYLGGK